MKFLILNELKKKMMEKVFNIHENYEICKNILSENYQYQH